MEFEKLSDYISKKLEKAHVSHQEIARLLGISKFTLSKILHNKRKMYLSEFIELFVMLDLLVTDSFIPRTFYDVLKGNIGEFNDGELLDKFLKTYPPAHFEDIDVTSSEDFEDYLEEYDMDVVEDFLHQFGQVYANNPCFKEKEYLEYLVLKEHKFQYVLPIEDMIPPS